MCHQFATSSATAGEKSVSQTSSISTGVNLSLVVVSLYLEARYTWIFTEGSTSTYVPVSLGITF